MSLDTQQVETVTFDSFTTIVDVMGTTTRALSSHIENGGIVADVARLWRFRAVEYRMLSNALDTYESYEETTRDALEYALAANDLALADGDVAEIVSQFHSLDVYDDVSETFERLDGLGYDLYVVSNGTPDLLDSIVAAADIGAFVADTVSADDIQTYKPEPEFYRHAVDQTDTSAENVLHVATPWYDVYGANNAGMQTVWVNRQDDPWERYQGNPDETLASLAPLPSRLE